MELVINLSKLAHRLRLPREWLRGEALAGRIPCLRVGRRLFFNPTAVEQALAERAANDRVSTYAV
jgi:hypothetical protein